MIRVVHPGSGFLTIPDPHQRADANTKRQTFSAAGTVRSFRSCWSSPMWAVYLDQLTEDLDLEEKKYVRIH
jgi:hypothetical protein